jgi:hypothetical protein
MCNCGKFHELLSLQELSEWNMGGETVLAVLKHICLASSFEMSKSLSCFDVKAKDKLVPNM